MLKLWDQGIYHTRLPGIYILSYATSVEDLGPLFVLSSFQYEDFNRDFRYMLHGTRQVGMQVLTAIGISQTIPILTNHLEINQNHNTFIFSFQQLKAQSTKRTTDIAHRMFEDTLTLTATLDMVFIKKSIKGFITPSVDIHQLKT